MKTIESQNKVIENAVELLENCLEPTELDELDELYNLLRQVQKTGDEKTDWGAMWDILVTFSQQNKKAIPVFQPEWKERAWQKYKKIKTILDNERKILSKKAKKRIRDILGADIWVKEVEHICLYYPVHKIADQSWQWDRKTIRQLNQKKKDIEYHLEALNELFNDPKTLEAVRTIMTGCARPEKGHGAPFFSVDAEHDPFAVKITEYVADFQRKISFFNELLKNNKFTRERNSAGDWLVAQLCIIAIWAKGAPLTHTNDEGKKQGTVMQIINILQADGFLPFGTLRSTVRYWVRWFNELIDNKMKYIPCKETSPATAAFLCKELNKYSFEIQK